MPEIIIVLYYTNIESFCGQKANRAWQNKQIATGTVV